MLGVVPPNGRGLHVDGVGADLFQEVFGAVGEGGGGVGCADEGERAASARVGERGLGVCDGVEAVGDPVEGVAVEVGIAQESVHNFAAAHNNVYKTSPNIHLN
jgi:hypothetical protein